MGIADGGRLLGGLQRLCFCFVEVTFYKEGSVQFVICLNVCQYLWYIQSLKDIYSCERERVLHLHNAFTSS